MTYDDALALAKAYHDATGKSATNFMAYSSVVQADGIPLLSEDKKKAVFNTPETLALMEKFKAEFGSGAIAPGSLGANQRDLPQSLENKQIAFDPVAVSSSLLNIQKNSPAVYGSIVVGPPVAGSDGKYYMSGQQIIGIPARSDNQAAAAAWIKYVTAPEQQLALCRLVPIYPSSVKALADPFSPTSPATRRRQGPEDPAQDVHQQRRRVARFRERRAVAAAVRRSDPGVHVGHEDRPASLGRRRTGMERHSREGPMS